MTNDAYGELFVSQFRNEKVINNLIPLNSPVNKYNCRKAKCKYVLKTITYTFTLCSTTQKSHSISQTSFVQASQVLEVIPTPLERKDTETLFKKEWNSNSNSYYNNGLLLCNYINIIINTRS